MQRANTEYEQFFTLINYVVEKRVRSWLKVRTEVRVTVRIEVRVTVRVAEFEVEIGGER